MFCSGYYVGNYLAVLPCATVMDAYCVNLFAISSDFNASNIVYISNLDLIVIPSSCILL